MADKSSQRGSKKYGQRPVIGGPRTPLTVKGDRSTGMDNISELSLQQGKAYQEQVNARLENTFKMKPDEDQKFYSDKVEDVMRRILNNKLEKEEYDRTKFATLAKELSTEIKARVKEFQWMRHKVVVQVVVGQNSEQDVNFGSRCLWDLKTDNYACASYKNENFFASAACFGIYFE